MMWKTIMNKRHPILTQRVWKVGSGHKIPILHPSWYPPKSLVNPSILQHINIVVDLIDHENSSWKVSLVRQLYDKEDGDKILSIPISNMTYENILDKIIWPIAQNGEYNTPKAYEILLNSIK
jgi:hypothetical protein